MRSFRAVASVTTVKVMDSGSAIAYNFEEEGGVDDDGGLYPKYEWQ